MKTLDVFRNVGGEPLMELVETTLADGSKVQDIRLYALTMYPATESQAQALYCELVALFKNNNAERY